MEVFKIIFEALKSPNLIFPIFICSGLILFLPEDARKTIGVDFINKDYRTWVGGAFLISCAALVTKILVLISTPIAAIILEKINVYMMRKRLHKLTNAEKRILAHYIVNQTRSHHLNIMDGVVSGLESATIIYRSSSIGMGMGDFSYNIQPWAWDYLRKKPELLEPVVTVNKK